MASSSNNLNKSLPESTTQLHVDTAAITTTSSPGIGISAELQLEEDSGKVWSYTPPKPCTCLRCRNREAIGASTIPGMQLKRIVRSKPCECFACTKGRSISGRIWSYEKFLDPPEQKSPPTSLNGSCNIESRSGGDQGCEQADRSAMLQEEDEDRDKQLLNIRRALSELAQPHADKQTMDLYSSPCKWGSLSEYMRNVIVKYKSKSKSSKPIKEKNLVVVSMAVYAFCIAVFEP